MRIITEATSEPITLAQARKQCKIDAEYDTSSPPVLVHEDDDLLTEVYMPAAREWCEAYLGMILAPTLVEIALTDFPTAEITLERGPVLGSVSIAYVDADGVQQIVDDTVFELDTTGAVAVLRLREDKAWPASDGSNDNVRVQYEIGYAAESESPQSARLPRSIKAAILMLVAHLYKHRESTVEKALSEMPMGVKFFLSPIKIRRGFA